MLCLFFVQLNHLSTKTYEPPKLRLNRTSEEYQEENEAEETDDDGDERGMNEGHTETWSYNANSAGIIRGFISNILFIYLRI